MWSSLAIIVHQIKRFFQIMREAKLTTDLIKSESSKAAVKYLGHIVGQGQVRPLDAKILTISRYGRILSKKVKFVCTDDCQLAFDKVKLFLQKSPFL